MSAAIFGEYGMPLPNEIAASDCVLLAMTIKRESPRNDQRKGGVCCLFAGGCLVAFHPEVAAGDFEGVFITGGDGDIMPSQVVLQKRFVEHSPRLFFDV